MTFGVRFMVRDLPTVTGQVTARLIALCCLGLVVLAARPAQAQEPLALFKNYFVTGDYVVRGASLWRKGIDGKAVAERGHRRRVSVHPDGRENPGIGHRPCEVRCDSAADDAVLR
jgi:hypothetical protein